jgi:hypothetical protein
VAPVHIEDLIHFLATALVSPEHNQFSATLRMIGVCDLEPMNMGVMKGIRTVDPVLRRVVSRPPRARPTYLLLTGQAGSLPRYSG